MSPGDLDGLLAPMLAGERSPDLLVGFDTSDDAGVYRLDSERALVVTADFITPVVDDARTFGQVAAANSLSDVYAMGGRPLTALNLAGYPQKLLPGEVLGQIFAGAAEVCARAGCVVAGGHTVRDDEVKFGLAVTGLVHPDRILRNSTARPGDVLVLTKPLGTGALVAANRAGQLSDQEYQALVTCMTTLNDVGAELVALGATACTDVTGFGLTGHGLEMARGARVQLVIEAARLPRLPRAAELCQAGFTCGGTHSNAAFTGPSLDLGDLDSGLVGLVHDPQTSGGLLISVPADRAATLCRAAVDHGALCAEIVGEVREHPVDAPYLVFR
ncbi:MAG: selenide, water dikinase SelD [Candidatus Krumholzibacteriia bacterium]